MSLTTYAGSIKSESWAPIGLVGSKFGSKAGRGTGFVVRAKQFRGKLLPINALTGMVKKFLVTSAHLVAGEGRNYCLRRIKDGSKGGQLDCFEITDDMILMDNIYDLAVIKLPELSIFNHPLQRVLFDYKKVNGVKGFYDSGYVMDERYISTLGKVGVTSMPLNSFRDGFRDTNKGIEYWLGSSRVLIGDRRLFQKSTAYTDYVTKKDGHLNLMEGPTKISDVLYDSALDYFKSYPSLVSGKQVMPSIIVPGISGSPVIDFTNVEFQSKFIMRTKLKGIVMSYNNRLQLSYLVNPKHLIALISEFMGNSRREESQLLADNSKGVVWRLDQNANITYRTVSTSLGELKELHSELINSGDYDTGDGGDYDTGDGGDYDTGDGGDYDTGDGGDYDTGDGGDYDTGDGGDYDTGDGGDLGPKRKVLRPGVSLNGEQVLGYKIKLDEKENYIYANWESSILLIDEKLRKKFGEFEISPIKSGLGKLISKKFVGKDKFTFPCKKRNESTFCLHIRIASNVLFIEFSENAEKGIYSVNLSEIETQFKNKGTYIYQDVGDKTYVLDIRGMFLSQLEYFKENDSLFNKTLGTVIVSEVEDGKNAVDFKSKEPFAFKAQF